MAAVVSASPVTLQSHGPEVRRHSTRAAARMAATRSYATKPFPRDQGFKHSMRRQSTDSSDDEDLAPIKLSAEAQAILGEDNSHVASDKENVSPARGGLNESGNEMRALGSNRGTEHQNWDGPVQRDGSPAPRVMRVRSAGRPSPPTHLERDGSFAYKTYDKSKTAGTVSADSRTPASRIRRVRVGGSRSQTRSPSSSSSNANKATDQSHHDYVSPSEDANRSSPGDDIPPTGPSTVMRTRRIDGEGVHSTMRVRRIGAGTLLNGPVRRGMIRRPSEEEEDDNDLPMGYKNTETPSPEIQYGRRAEVELDNNPDDLLSPTGSPQPRKRMQSPASNPVLQRQPTPKANEAREDHLPLRPHVLSTSISRPEPTPFPNGSHSSSKSSGSSRKPIFKIPSLPPLESAHDQENEPPPTFKRSKPSSTVLELPQDKMDGVEEKKPNVQSQAKASPPRQALAPRENNTPRRPAPAPPPKMSLIEAATSTAGNSRSKKSVHYVLNGRQYRRLDPIGRGGSSRVFRIMAENYKIFALKRVNLEEADMTAIAGYKGEIELLKKLENVDRVIRLFDYEINEEKSVLNVVMELGETDFNKMLNEQLKADNAKLDITFTRHYWKEMLECVQAVHDYDIVHSDLKPANFLLVKGQLKLIDFGIANAIQDNTVNVHRENQIGTPNYMSPESLVCHQPAAGQKAGTKLLKLGKPSDVWSLGCILYQMTYGQPPFAHITKQFERIMSIPNPKVEIQFPTAGVGGAVVPFGLIKTLRRCLQRDQTLRPTIKELLSDQDPFLNPVSISPDMLGRVIGNVVSYCRKREENFRQQGQLGQEGVSCLPKDDEMRGWPLAFYEKLKQAQEEGTAW